MYEHNVQATVHAAQTHLFRSSMRWTRRTSCVIVLQLSFQLNIVMFLWCVLWFEINGVSTWATNWFSSQLLWLHSAPFLLHCYSCSLTVGELRIFWPLINKSCIKESKSSFSDECSLSCWSQVCGRKRTICIWESQFDNVFEVAMSIIHGTRPWWRHSESYVERKKLLCLWRYKILRSEVVSKFVIQ
jgi:hypothetical protein